MALQDVVRWLLPREDRFFTFLERQATVAHKGAQALAEFKPGRRIEDVQSAVQVLEHDGDKIVHELEEALGQTFVTPIDREDLQHLASELDDILDLTNSAARACALFGVETPTEPMTQLIAILVRATEELERTVPLLAKRDFAGLMKHSRSIRGFEKDA